MFDATFYIPDYPEEELPGDWTPGDPWNEIGVMEKERLFDEMCQTVEAACGVQCPAWPCAPVG